MDKSPGAGPRARLRTGARLLVLSAVALAAVGAVGRGIGWILLTTTLGPTAYILLAHPDTEAAQVRSSVLGHTSAAACGLACLAAFGLWDDPSTAAHQSDNWRQICAQALAVGLTLFLLVVLKAHHPPAAATALLITSGIARPGPPLYGMLTGLAILITTAAVLSRVPATRARAPESPSDDKN
ncbi:HPP family protein [Streptomyces sp. 150FB]|uniref:HPP family protein n=1 Tax=Streptomyces sp. 150FB TaxID=1576605 RepID=UPI000695A9A9|nr:HPP family protein [Streptomyces sp. 150FB]